MEARSDVLSSPRSAAQAAPEELAYVVTLNTGSNGDAKPDALTVVDLKPGSPHRLQPPAHRPLRPRRALRLALGAPDGDGPGGVFLLDHDSFDPLGRWEIDRGPQELAYDVWWNIG